VYDVIVQARDSLGATDTQALDIVVTNVAGTNVAGTAAANTLTGGSEEDTIRGMGGNDTLSGAGGNDLLQGGGGKDTLIGGTGDDRLYGGAGDDVLIYDAADGIVNGGLGTDTLRLTGSGATLDLTLVPNTRLTDIELIDATGTGNNTVRLALADVLAMSSTTDTLRILGNAGDALVATDVAGWVKGADQTIGGNVYHAYQQGAGTLLFDADMMTNLPG
jgi:Ca2+-binding RTX toxin-like protein